MSSHCIGFANTAKREAHRASLFLWLTYLLKIDSPLYLRKADDLVK